MSEKWKTLTDDQKFQYVNYCNERFKQSGVFCATGEPMYFDSDLKVIRTDLIIDLLFSSQAN